MVENGQAGIREVGFRPPSRPARGVEVLSLAALYRRERPARLRAPHRVAFHQMVLVTGGAGGHTVDFVDYPCGPGTLLWVRPGQVQRYAPWPALEATLVLFTGALASLPAGARPDGVDAPGPVYRQLDASERALVATVVGQLAAECARPADGASTALLRHLIAVLLLQVGRLFPAPAGGGHAGGDVFARFQRELERSYATTRRAAEYAARLGYSPRTLTRVCLAATGRPAKRVIDDRVVLEAKRLLAHTGAPVAAVGRRLGFAEATAFGAFFTRRAGQTPGAFRRAAR